MNQKQKKESLLRNGGFQTIIGSLLCIIIGLLVGYVVLLIINPSGAGNAIVAILKNFLYYPSAAAAKMYFGTTLVKSSALLMCSLSVLFAWKVGLFNIGAAGQYVIGVPLLRTEMGNALVYLSDCCSCDSSDRWRYFRCAESVF